MDSTLTFHILFLPGTVRDLSLFLITLQQWAGDVKLKLWSNGCQQDETDLLCRLADGHDNTTFEKFSDSLEEHGPVLTELQRRESSRWFAIMDSDIFATGAFAEPLLRKLQGAAAVFSCPPIWSCEDLDRLKPGYQAMHGVNSLLVDGSCIGNTFLAIYDNHVLTNLIEETGATFHQLRWNQLPDSIQKQFLEHNFKKELYDTGKVINLLLRINGHRLEYLPSPNLVHIGGLSGLAKRRFLHRQTNTNTSWKYRLYSRVPRFVRMALAGTGLLNHWGASFLSRELDWEAHKVFRRIRTSIELSDFLEALQTGASYEPNLKGLDQWLSQNIRSTQSTLRELYRLKSDTLRGLTQGSNIPNELSGT